MLCVRCERGASAPSTAASSWRLALLRIPNVRLGGAAVWQCVQCKRGALDGGVQLATCMARNPNVRLGLAAVWRCFRRKRSEPRRPGRGSSPAALPTGRGARHTTRGVPLQPPRCDAALDTEHTCTSRSAPRAGRLLGHPDGGAISWGASALATAASGSRHASLGDPNFWLASGCARSNLSLHG